jgi:hypothetical protein
MKIKIEIKNKNNFFIQWCNWKKNQFNKKNKDKIKKKKHILNRDWRMKLKINQNFIKRTRTKLRNKKNKDLNGNTLKS